MLGKPILFPVLFSALTCLSVNAKAAYIPLNLTLNVNRVVQSPPLSCAGLSLRGAFGCSNAVGDVHVGRFEIDNSILSMEGDNIRAEVRHFLLQIGNVIWDQDHPSDLLGFRGGNTGNVASLGINVHGGVITGLVGGIYGFSDAPFVDFNIGNIAGSFSAVDLRSTNLIGTFQVTPAQVVPEPGSFALAAAALVGLGMASRKSAKAQPA